MNAKLLAWIVLPLVGLVLVGMLAVWLLEALLGFAFYLIAGAVLVGGGILLYRRIRREVAPGTRTRLRIEAANQTRRNRR